MNRVIFTRMLKAAYDEACAAFDPHDTGLYEYPFSFEEVKWFFDLFFRNYRVCYGKEHPNVTKQKAIEYIQKLPVIKYAIHPEGEADSIVRLKIADYEKLLVRYFAKQYRYPHSLPHFFAGRTRSFLFAEVFM